MRPRHPREHRRIRHPELPHPVHPQHPPYRPHPPSRSPHHSPRPHRSRNSAVSRLLSRLPRASSPHGVSAMIRASVCILPTHQRTRRPLRLPRRRRANAQDCEPTSSALMESQVRVRNPLSHSRRLPPPPEKKPRKKWTMEETQMLVAGCNKWGVGNWKSILNDPEFKFDGRSPVDLKDRFRTYYPDAYRQHYPNAKTHLSSKVRSALPDGTSIFEKTRSKKRRPFTEEEDRALKAGYDKHGTVWATIVKDPIFQAQNRRSTDLRDRFRNAFPDLYQAAGYKPRNTTKKKKDQPSQPNRAPQMTRSRPAPLARPPEAAAHGPGPLPGWHKECARERERLGR
ncbi:hypothetical protein NUW54_g10713 [Trametes sanguinea]|uniref:Uncharacterized protein n=1 Tax=Trametes sanguinea TaxID=158606 RepID=A0ACC1NVY1_9APHY|nr:hypothetical protein NUW54_g10713 [Trametes sanguinea]